MSKTIPIPVESKFVAIFTYRFMEKKSIKVFDLKAKSLVDAKKEALITQIIYNSPKFIDKEEELKCCDYEKLEDLAEEHLEDDIYNGIYEFSEVKVSYFIKICKKCCLLFPVEFKKCNCGERLIILRQEEIDL